MSDENILSTLEEQLEQLKQARNIKTSPEIIALRLAETKKLIKSGIAEQSLHTGDQAPDFTLSDADGQRVTLSALLETGPTVVTFYRGEWCPYCNLTLRVYQALLPQIKSMKAVLVAISPQHANFSQAMITKADLTFPVLSDVGNNVARRYRLVFTVPEVLRPYTANLPKFDGDEFWELPLSGTFVIGQDGVIHTAFAHADYTKRMEPAAILSALTELHR